MDTHLVPCCLKDRGCIWTGTLDQLDTHLKDNCQYYVDTKCPLNCLQTIPKNKMDQHVAQECTKRPHHVCRQSSFKAAFKMFEQQSTKSDCSKVRKNSSDEPKRESENELKKLRPKSEAVERKISDEKSDKALMRNSLCSSSKFEKTVDFEEKFRKLELKICEYELKFQEMDKQKLQQQELNKMILNILDDQEQEILACNAQLKAVQEEKEELVTQLQTQGEQLERLQQFTSAKKAFVVKNFSTSVKRSGWKSRCTYLRMGGCKFSISIDFTSPTDVRFSVQIHKGVFDHEMKWPSYMNFTMVLTNQKGGSDLSKCFVSNVEQGLFYKVMTIDLYEVEDYLRHNVLHFTILK